MAVIKAMTQRMRQVYTHALGELEAVKSLVIGVTSAVRQEGRTLGALGLALSIAQDLEKRVVLVELDLDNPILARELGIAASPGLGDVLSGEASLATAIRSNASGSFATLPAGNITGSATRLLRSSALRTLVQSLRNSFDVTILDLPPALDNPDVVSVSNLADGVLLIVRGGATPAPLVQQTVRTFAAGKVRGIVLNGHHSKIPHWIRRLFP
ncbi:MAG: CpsD/CapB family tyrosine-protein kinase [Chloroflexi bacterium]|nr:CpsD/CapB family tyrosine-protein kinase [Chloroflexota bacterium]